jgi:CheY-like chemotaxis protein
VFDRFRQADSSTTRHQGGLGLGLAIVKQLTELHGGQISAKSGGEGHGATFSVILPLAVARHGCKRRQHPTHFDGGSPVDDDRLSLEGTTVLVVDDEDDARELIRRLLAERHARVLIAESADQGLEMLRLEKPDLILSDIGMPEKDGYEFIRTIRKLSVAEGGRTPAIALTAFARSEDRTRAMMAGYQVHLSKPVEAQELVATVGSLVGRTGA